MRHEPHTQIIATASGEKLVVLTKADYDRLIAAVFEAQEHIRDIAAFDAAVSQPTAKVIEVERDAALAIFIRARRKQYGLTQTELAAASGVGQGFVSDIESGRRRPSAEVLAKLAAALFFDPAALDETSPGAGR
ncbi:helix-turn-helix domain-containing protein [Methylopila sp. Yamaguchi]|uniref:helix-turn-helix domain-containing protein n=1 Tax=Methylopila sp. Yamaguchi TaxID=1437817 RepID=UPI000CB41FEA|nr:helix-turn-helix domain-containing protein [Methylopila sp. Yamaguchi]GBD48113.1 XRE family transcriptional regulator [Methylopila sp. Yamaguchi]